MVKLRSLPFVSLPKIFFFSLSNHPFDHIYHHIVNWPSWSSNKPRLRKQSQSDPQRFWFYFVNLLLFQIYVVWLNIFCLKFGGAMLGTGHVYFVSLKRWEKVNRRAAYISVSHGLNVSTNNWEKVWLTCKGAVYL